MIPLDAQVTPIDLNAAAMQVARGSPVTDADGTRRATLLFPQGTTATLVMPDGSHPAADHAQRAAPRSTRWVRTDRSAMPAALPPTSGYTYAVELSADEAIAAGATSVTFNQPLPFYVENFLGFPVGSLVPIGLLRSRSRRPWVPSTTAG